MSAPVGEHDAVPPVLSPGRFAGRSVLITGAVQGIGRAVADRVVREGGAVTVVDRADLIASVADELTTVSPESIRVTPVEADLETFEGARAAADAALTAHGRIDVLINNVGGTIWARPYHEYSADQIEAEVRRSLFPTLWMCRAVLPAMVDRGVGTIVNVSSVATRGVNRVPYAASKGGVNGLTSALALEAAPHGVRVVATAPGGTLAPERRVSRGGDARTEQEKAWYSQIVDQTVESTALGRYGTLHEQAAPICFLASDEASYITGSVLPVAGGDQG
ncbi:1,6-dihydroxycyclohexa-2,4-diene-1-carboxylate dehydrogenase [Dietzia aurantiaca]|uniref:1,6-dihydroxycyclohexa-2,4-diene-1-carboxylate dehydrogenase n=1 Tax=Dietzia aurantiaca TaxID=983873 RepID=UPI001E32C425|nr:1,6-dihydroxycyclohexa-2,4-diene-1-carboxylate dehydrogenase [Dietzia aurantiaca]MCD2263743.1 1,6-dihydroxycyclohexa-2,4-diene-1-carboxylate dehydrogenase [Dietzia aurantiaca]